MLVFEKITIIPTVDQQTLLLLSLHFVFDSLGCLHGLGEKHKIRRPIAIPQNRSTEKYCNFFFVPVFGHAVNTGVFMLEATVRYQKLVFKRVCMLGGKGSSGSHDLEVIAFQRSGPC